MESNKPTNKMPDEIFATTNCWFLHDVGGTKYIRADLVEQDREKQLNEAAKRIQDAVEALRKAPPLGGLDQAAQKAALEVYPVEPMHDGNRLPREKLAAIILRHLKGTEQ